ncbi:hypothetical protein NG799_27755 [Laspinema sp. D1]|uniref:Phage protein n=1 Tax=Laspinema palackyanum D2a TaxID=2953684 RepID=A0ABT2MZE1_9CYAN|nr:hypothetical protein [Laspinema sp. D2a]
MKESLTYTIMERFPEGQSTLTLYATPNDFDGITYYYEHDQINRSCGSFTEAIALAQSEWERMKESLIILEFKPELTEEEKAEIPF